MINQKRDPLLGKDCLYYYIHHFSVSVNKIDSFPLIFHLTRRIIIILCVGHIFYMKCRDTKKILQVDYLRLDAQKQNLGYRSLYSWASHLMRMGLQKKWIRQWRTQDKVGKEAKKSVVSEVWHQFDNSRSSGAGIVPQRSFFLRTSRLGCYPSTLCLSTSTNH